ncbi:glycosyltransferase family 10 domain-containing protein [Flavobacterium sp. ZT3R17]|uniref:glycosyltransferase family 10 domain-containing protein n=1 Tax=Flavobacterium cryoconiti TaxID=3398736 RepID=UPI003A8571DD
MLIKIERYYNYPDLKRQTPNCSMQWKDFTFTEAAVEECDYLVILDYPKVDFSIKVNPNNILSVCLEPPNEVSKYRQYANKKVAVIYNQLDIKKNNVLSHGALPWHVDKDYDFLMDLKQDDLIKEDKIVWITSDQRNSKGHHIRMDFLDSIKGLPFVDLYGRGIKPIADKWEVLQHSKYAIAYENFQNEYYWTEKIMDCFLSYTMPIYFGCTAIENYFPKNSFIQIDPKDKHIALFLKEIVSSKKWEENIEAIITARNLVLNKYQLFPFLYDNIKTLEAIRGNNLFATKEFVSFKCKNDYFDNYPVSVKLEKEWCKLKRKINRKF